MYEIWYREEKDELKGEEYERRSEDHKKLKNSPGQIRRS
jgi:hypothetical protein